MSVIASAPTGQPTVTDDARLAVVQSYDVLDTPNEISFDRIANLIKLSLRTDAAIVSVIDGHRQWYKAAVGTNLKEVEINDSFCRITVAGTAPVVVSDATLDPRFCDNPYVLGDAKIRSYIGVPLGTPEGVNIGTLCAFGQSPRQFTETEIRIIAELAKLAESELQLRHLAGNDSLTGTMTRRAFKEEAAKYVNHARRYRTRLSVLAFDIDHFKLVNDTYGHAVGDKVLSDVGRAALEQLRQSDLVGRLGGEEFAIFLPETDERGALEVAEKLRQFLRSMRFPGSHPPLQVSASFGVVMFNPDEDDLDRVLLKADEALYEAKRQGRNKVVAWKGTTTSTTRQVMRRRVLKAGRLIFNDLSSVVSCTVRAIWDAGAEVGVASTSEIPDELVLEIMSDHTRTPAQVVARRPLALEVAFRT